MAASSHHSFIDKEVLCGSLQTSIRAPGHYIHCQSQQLMLEGYYYFQNQFLIQILPTIPMNAYALHGTCYQEDSIFLLYIIHNIHIQDKITIKLVYVELDFLARLYSL